MSKNIQNLDVDRGIALHKLIRLITLACSTGGYLNFMGNEFGHPEWIDFPREGNNWSYWYARRQWSLRDNTLLKYHFLADFDREMIELLKQNNALEGHYPQKIYESTEAQIIVFKRHNLVFLFNFSPTTPVNNFPIELEGGHYNLLLSSDAEQFGGFGMINNNQTYYTSEITTDNNRKILAIKVYIPPRVAIVLQKG